MSLPKFVIGLKINIKAYICVLNTQIKMEKQNIHIAVDAVVLGYHNRQMHVLLIKRKFGDFKGRWALPGGFVEENEGIRDAIIRELKEETSVQIGYLEQLYTFGDNIYRDPRGRVISISYFALVNSSQIQPSADTDAEDARWFPLHDLPLLAFDHQEIIQYAKKRLKNKITYQPIGFDLLDSKFTFSELEQLYVSIAGKDIDRRNFRKKILSLGILTETRQMIQPKTGRPAKLYQFNKSRYEQLKHNGFHFDISFT